MTPGRAWTFVLLLALAACSAEPSADRGPAAEPGNGSVAAGIAPDEAPVAARWERPVTPQAKAPAPAAADDVLTVEGLGALKLGPPVPAGGSWAERGAQISEECRTVSSPDFPGVYAIVEGGTVRRITIGERSDLKLAQGIGVGASEAEVRAAFPGLREEPHHYVEGPAKYLTSPNAANGKPALRFETGADGRVSLIHAGTMPVLGYVEGCA